MTTTPEPSPLPDRVRRRAMLGLFSGAALGATSYIPAFSVAPLIAEGMLGSSRWSGLPGAVAIGGLAVGATLLSAVMARRGRRVGLALGFGVASAAAALAALAVTMRSLPAFLLAVALFGCGLGARHLSRYAAADLYPVAHHGAAISVVVWAGTVGSVVGPLLLAPAQGLAVRLGLPGFAGPYLLAACASLLACGLLAVLLPPLPLASDRAPTVQLPGAAAVARLAELRHPVARFALVSMVAGQFVMVLVMAMTPVHIHGAGEGLGIVGLVISAHTLGMFALSPLTGLLADRIGRVPVILAGAGMILVSVLVAAPAHGDHRWTLVGALFLLGLGWNFGFVAGTALLTESVPAAERVRLQGLADSLVWSAAALANLVSGVLLASAGYPGLNLVGAAVIVVPPLLALRDRRHLAAA